MSILGSLFWVEIVLHGFLHGQPDMLFWNSNTTASGGPYDDAQVRLFAKAMREVRTLIDFVDCRHMSINCRKIDLRYARYAISGTSGNGRRVYRVTPQPREYAADLEVADRFEPELLFAEPFTARLSDGTILQIPNSRVYTPANPCSDLGWWVIEDDPTPDSVSSSESCFSLIGHEAGGGGAGGD